MQQGISYVRNRGIAEAAGEYIVFSGRRREANSEFAEKYFCFFENNKEKNAAGGAVIPVYEAPVPKWFSHYIEKMITGVFDMGARVVPFRGKSYPAWETRDSARRCSNDTEPSILLLGRSGTNPLGGEEKDFFMRLRAAGERYYFVPGAQIYHITPAYKLTEDYFNRLSRMIGVSERIRTRTQGPVSLRKTPFRRSDQMGRNTGSGLWFSASHAADQGKIPDPDAKEHHLRITDRKIGKQENRPQEIKWKAQKKY